MARVRRPGDRAKLAGRPDPLDRGTWLDRLGELRILIVHAGGDSRRVPAYGPCGKVFIPVPGDSDRALGTSLLDRQLPVYLGLPAPGPGRGQVVITSGDVLLTFDSAGVRFTDDGLTGLGCYAAPGDARRGPYVLGIDLRGNGQLLGHVGFSPLGDAVEVSYAIAEDARGRGYATEALAEACCWAADAFALPGLIAVTAMANEASRRLLERVGFRHLCDEVMRFQETEQLVGRYLWTPVSPPASGA